MSDTSPKNQDALLSGHRRAAADRTPREAEELWHLRCDGALLCCELLDDSRAGAGYEVRLRKDDELIFGRRCGTRVEADDVAEAFRQDHLRTGWTAA